MAAISTLPDPGMFSEEIDKHKIQLSDEKIKLLERFNKKFRYRRTQVYFPCEWVAVSSEERWIWVIE